MLQLRRISDQIFSRRAGDKLASGLAEVRGRMEEMGGRVVEVGAQSGKVARKAYARGNEAARTALDYAMAHRKATAAVVLGAGVAAGLLWMMQRVRRTAATRSRSRRHVANATE